MPKTLTSKAIALAATLSLFCASCSGDKAWEPAPEGCQVKCEFSIVNRDSVEYEIYLNGRVILSLSGLGYMKYGIVDYFDTSPESNIRIIEIKRESAIVDTYPSPLEPELRSECIDGVGTGFDVQLRILDGNLHSL